MIAAGACPGRSDKERKNMDTQPHPTGRPRQHPLLILAALAVILFSIVGTAAIMGWLPSSNGNNRDRLSDADRAALAAAVQQPAAPVPYPAQPGVPVGAAAAGAYPAAPAPLAPVAPAQPGYAQAYAPGSAAYGASGSQGATGSGGDDYAPAEPVRSAPKAEHKPARVADAESDERWCASCGNVESVRALKTRAQGSGVGAAGGAILGGLLGNQVGSGHGRQLATVAGAVGGAVLGNQVEGNVRADTSYEIRVRLDDGTLRTFHQQSAPRWRTGDRVRIVKGSLRAA
jgi:outer membrane lipoprotein SlyB